MKEKNILCEEKYALKIVVADHDDNDGMNGPCLLFSSGAVVVRAFITLFDGDNLRGRREGKGFKLTLFYIGNTFFFPVLFFLLLSP